MGENYNNIMRAKIRRQGGEEGRLTPWIRFDETHA